MIDAKVKTSGRSRTDFLIRAITDKPVAVIANGGEILAELKRHGNNLNQAVKNNYFGYATERELLQAAMDSYDPSVIGYLWDDENPRIQLEPRGQRGYIELRAVRRIQK